MRMVQDVKTAIILRKKKLHHADSYHEIPVKIYFVERSFKEF